MFSLTRVAWNDELQADVIIPTRRNVKNLPSKCASFTERHNAILRSIKRYK